MIELQNVTLSYGGHRVLENFSAAIPLSGVTAVTGPSGSGKTTLLRLLMGLLTVSSGSIVGLDNLRPAVVFQENRLIPWRTALENVALVSEQETAKEYLVRLGLGAALHEKPAQLSGGMQRRVAIARALSFGGDLLLLDEPFTGLDEEARRIAAGVLLSSKLPMVMVSHDPEELTLLHAEHKIEVPLLIFPARPDSPAPAPLG